MNFQWDEGKSDECFRTRGFDFAYAAWAFSDPDRIIRKDNRFSYGEGRYQLTGRIEKRLRPDFHAAPRRNSHHFCSESQSTRGQTL